MKIYDNKNPNPAVFVYGSKFDPVTKAHISIIEQLLGMLRPCDDLKLFIDSYSPAGEDVCNRHIVLMETLCFIDPKYGTDSSGHLFNCIVHQNKRTYEFLKDNPEYSGKRIVLVMGSDRARDFNASVNGESTAWEHAQELAEMVEVLEINPRPSLTGVRASLAREKLLRDPMCSYDAVREYLLRSTFEVIASRGVYCHSTESMRRGESVFIRNYDETKYPRPSVTATVLVWRKDPSTISSGCGVQVLLVRRRNPPYALHWALPGGFFDPVGDYSVVGAAIRELHEETGAHIPEEGRFRQFGLYSERGIDPRMRVVDIAYHVRVQPDLPMWDGEVMAGDDAQGVGWFDIDDLPRLAFHHGEIVKDFILTPEFIGNCQDRPAAGRRTEAVP